MKVTKKDKTKTTYSIKGLTEHEAGRLMRFLVDGPYWGDYPEVTRVYNALEAAGATELRP